MLYFRGSRGSEMSLHARGHADICRQALAGRWKFDGSITHVTYKWRTGGMFVHRPQVLTLSLMFNAVYRLVVRPAAWARGCL